MTYSTTCGHPVESLDDLFDLQIKDYNQDGTPCVTYGVYCQSCADHLWSTDMILGSLKAEEAWLKTPNIDKSNTTIKALAIDLSSHNDPIVAKFARLVYNTFVHSTPEVTINTDGMFTVMLGEHEITDKSTVIFQTVDAAIIALNSAHITWVRPFKINLLEEIYEVSETDFDCGNFLIEYCQEAALALLDGNTPYIKHDGGYTVEVVIPT